MKSNKVKTLATLILILSNLQIDTALAQREHHSQDHSMGQMQGGSPPADARDPHVYADGYTLTDRPYTQPGLMRLKLADEYAFWAILGDRFEYQDENDTMVYDIQAWYGTTYNRLVIKAEGDVEDGTLQESVTDLLWSHALKAYFDTRLGLRSDQYDQGKERYWLALGIQGLAPYWFELEITAYFGNHGRSALVAEVEYELLLTQRLILQPRAELNLYGKDDPENNLGKGLSELALGLRLRYEVNRQFAPYLGVEWTNTYRDTEAYRRAAEEDTSATHFIAGLKFWL